MNLEIGRFLIFLFFLVNSYLQVLFTDMGTPLLSYRRAMNRSKVRKWGDIRLAHKGCLPRREMPLSTHSRFLVHASCSPQRMLMLCHIQLRQERELGLDTYPFQDVDAMCQYGCTGTAYQCQMYPDMNFGREPQYVMKLGYQYANDICVYGPDQNVCSSSL